MNAGTNAQTPFDTEGGGRGGKEEGRDDAISVCLSTDCKCRDPQKNGGSLKSLSYAGRAGEQEVRRGFLIWSNIHLYDFGFCEIFISRGNAFFQRIAWEF